jgi:hypothetical protein
VYNIREKYCTICYRSLLLLQDVVKVKFSPRYTLAAVFYVFFVRIFNPITATVVAITEMMAPTINS